MEHNSSVAGVDAAMSPPGIEQEFCAMTLPSHKTPVYTRHMSKIYAILERRIAHDALEIHTMLGSDAILII